jgi:hypothetical protein
MNQLQTPSPHVSQYPFQSVEGDLFPPVCLKTHWDPTQMLRHILPDQKVDLPQDFRPWVKVCKNYVTSGPAIKAPMPPKNMVFPSGGEFYPPGRYAKAIDDESVLRTLDWKLNKWCPNDQYIPPFNGDMYVPNATVPKRAPTNDAFVQELAMPQALLRTDTYTCRSENDVKYFDRSPRLFNNPTKQDRYGAGTFSALPGGVIPMPHGGVNVVPPTSSAIKGAYPVQMPGGRLPDTRMTNPEELKAVTKSLGTCVAGVAKCGSFAPA